MLRPDNHALLTTALRPPSGYALDRAVGTTFTLDLVTLMLSQLTFATQELGDDVDRVAPIALMDAVTRNASRTTIFVQGGGIAVPKNYRPLLALLEDSIVEVMAPEPKGLFHPKFWALRYRDLQGAVRHRVLVLSRNLTFDRSWDTMLVLDEAEPGSAVATMSGEEFADFTTWMPDLATRPFASDGIADLASTLRAAELALPVPYSTANAEIFGRGEAMDVGWRGSHGLLISPFLSRGIVEAIAEPLESLKVVSTRFELDKLQTPPRNTALYTLNPAVDPEHDDEPERPTDVLAMRPPLRGLHAKVLIVDDGRRSWTWTGSANATSSALSRNVELMVTLWASRREAGVDTTWAKRTDTDLGIEQMVVPYEPQRVDPRERLREELERVLTTYQIGLAALDTTTTVETLADETYSLTVEVPEAAAAIQTKHAVTTTLRPLTLKQPQRLAGTQQWHPVSIAAVTPFIVATSTAESDGIQVRSACVLNTRLVGDPPERRDRVVRDVLKDRDDVLAYLAFLLGDPAAEAFPGHEELLDRLGSGRGDATYRLPPVVLFEPLVLAALGNTAAIHRVASLLEQLERVGELDKLPDGFLELWDVALAATGLNR